MTTRFVMLSLFFTIAHKLMFSNTFFIFLSFINVDSSSRNILTTVGLISNIDPGKMQQSLSLSCFLGESTVKAEQAVFVFYLFFEAKERKNIFLTNYL